MKASKSTISLEPEPAPRSRRQRLKEAIEDHIFISLSVTAIAAFGLGWGVPEALRLNARLTVIPLAELSRLNTEVATLKEERKHHVGSTREERPKPQHFSGTFKDMNGDKSEYFSQEELALAFSDHPIFSGVKLVHGSIEGRVQDETGKLVGRTWEVSGCQVGDTLVVSYFTADKKGASGSGAYYLRRCGGSFVGYWQGREGITGNHIKCPYVLTESKISMDDARKAYPILEVPCEILAFAEKTAGK